MKKYISLSLLILFAFAAQAVYAAQADAFPDLKITKATLTVSALVKTKIAGLLKSDNHIKTANDYLRKTFGLVPATGKENYWGMTIDAQNVKSKKKLTCTILMQDYKKGTKDIGLLAQVSVTTPDKQSEVYTFVLSAPGSKIENTKEFYVDRVRFTKMIPNSRGWITAVWESFASKCSKNQANALGTCKLATFTGFLNCLNQAGADCFQRVLVCASCGCAKNCIAITGCCER